MIVCMVGVFVFVSCQPCCVSTLLCWMLHWNTNKTPTVVNVNWLFPPTSFLIYFHYLPSVMANVGLRVPPTFTILGTNERACSCWYYAVAVLCAWILFLSHLLAVKQQCSILAIVITQPCIFNIQCSVGSFTGFVVYYCCVYEYSRAK